VDVFSGVCLSVCLFVCQDDELKRRMMKFGGQVHCDVQKSRPRSNVKVKGQGHRGQKNKTVRHFVRESSSGRGPRAASFSGAVLAARLRRWENQRILSTFRLVIAY